jgi:acetyltransferase-like isoleucine patch superfamily enzyme
MMIISRIYKRFLKLLAKNTPGYKLRRWLLRVAGYTIGKDVYIGEDLIIIDELEPRCPLSIGDRVSIAERVTLVISSRPNFSCFSKNMPTAYGPITIKEDAWLGTGVIILPNVTIGEGAVVGAGSVVNKNVPPFTVVAGVPARPVRKLTIQE